MTRNCLLRLAFVSERGFVCWTRGSGTSSRANAFSYRSVGRASMVIRAPAPTGNATSLSVTHLDWLSLAIESIRGDARHFLRSGGWSGTETESETGNIPTAASHGIRVGKGPPLRPRARPAHPRTSAIALGDEFDTGSG